MNFFVPSRVRTTEHLAEPVWTSRKYDGHVMDQRVPAHWSPRPGPHPLVPRYSGPPSPGSRARDLITTAFTRDSRVKRLPLRMRGSLMGRPASNTPAPL